ncbi:hypothetical protein H3N56_03100 [Cetobacterium sp. 2A]|uniref:hypothetical protein n=1 Tax=Cetobacterium sp. 2A TaxID=2754723 RepID=UPI00163D364C|nr:hypothetical protein [Cetobacterium sp. 2A]MBC2855482.1 hypothetical protein [Cetobacterium sp. 2A]
MKLIINDKQYTLKYNLLSRIKLSQKFESEQDMLELIQEQDLDSLVIFTRYCIQEDISDEEFLNSYPLIQETKQALLELSIKLIKMAVDPFELRTSDKDSEELEKYIKTDYKALILELMSKGYTQKEALNLTNWEISLVFESDYKKLEREVLHTNTIVNTMIGIMGGKEKFDLLNRKENTGSLEDKYPLESKALDLFYSLKNKEE